MKAFILAGSISLFFFTAVVTAQDTVNLNTFERGTTLARAGNFESALAEFNVSLREAVVQNVSDRALAQIHFNIGVCRYRLRHLDAAVAELKIAVKLRRDHQKAYYALGMAEAERHNLPAAEAAFVAAIRIDGHDGEAWFDLGSVYLEQKRLDKAKTAFEAAARYKTVDLAVSHNNIGVIVALSGDMETARAKFELALKISGGRLETARNNLAFCRRSLPPASLVASLTFESRAPALAIH
jgi:Flp pilus assembly protein TadD